MKRLGALGILVSALLAGCASPVATSDSILLGDGYIEVPAAPYQAGNVAIDIENVGDLDHTLVVTGADGSPIAATGSVAAGEVTRLTVDLAPGVYTVTCRIVVQLPDGTLLDHYELGMVSTITVDGPAVGAEMQTGTTAGEPPGVQSPTTSAIPQDDYGPSDGYGATTGNE